LNVDIQDAGTAARFFVTYACIDNKHKIITGSRRMQERPIEPLVNALKQIGFRIGYLRQNGFLPIEIIPTNLNNLGSEVSITGCEYLVARTGSMVMSSAQFSGRTTSVYAPVHICIAYNSQLVYDVKDALVFLKEKYKTQFPSFVTFATGPSRTADIEKTLVTGVHGPKEVYCFLVED
jgi:hypothetical protein